MTEPTDPGEFVFSRITMGLIGRDNEGKTVEGVVVEYSVGGGMRSTSDWLLDAEDREILADISNRFEAKIKDQIAGRQSFTPTSAVPGFEADKR